MSNLTIIVPAYNEEDGIEATIKNLTDYIASRNLEWKIIVVNDGSTDSTAEILNNITGVSVLNHPYNKGYGASLKTGIRKSETELVAFYDADGQHRPEDLESLYNHCSDYDMMIGQRDRDSYQNWIRKPGKWILSRVANYVTGRKIPDLNSGLRIMNLEKIQGLLHLFPNGFSLSTTSTIAYYNFGLSVGFIPITVKKRIGKSTVKQAKHGFQTIILILRLMMLFSPMKIFIRISLILFILGLVYEVVFGIVLIEGISIIPGALLMIITSVQIFLFGLLADQISEMRKFRDL